MAILAFIMYHKRIFKCTKFEFSLHMLFVVILCNRCSDRNFFLRNVIVCLPQILVIIALHIAGRETRNTCLLPIRVMGNDPSHSLGENKEFSQSFQFRKHILPNQVKLWGRLQQGKKEGKDVGYKENTDVYINKAKTLFCSTSSVAEEVRGKTKQFVYCGTFL